jgi:hypothetical protein
VVVHGKWNGLGGKWWYFSGAARKYKEKLQDSLCYLLGLGVNSQLIKKKRNLNFL